MAKQYVMFDVADSRAELIAEALGNKTCKRILSLLSEKDISETDIANKLSIPLNTAHYNVQKLVKAGLVEKKREFFWSSKGKKISTYTLSNKKIVISPRESFKNVLGVAVITGAAAFLIKLFSGSNEAIGGVDSFSYTQDVAYSKSAETVSAIATNMPAINDVTINNVNTGIGGWSWFLLGAWFALLIFMSVEIWREHSQK